MSVQRMGLMRRVGAMSTGAVLLVAAGFGATACGSSSSTKAETVSFRVVNTERAVTDIGAQGATMNDLLSVNGEMRDASGARIGRFDLVASTSGVAGGREVRLQTMEFDWDETEDSILVQAVNDFPVGGRIPDTDLPFAIIGGTGRYDTARGSCTMSPDDTGFDWTCTIK